MVNFSFNSDADAHEAKNPADRREEFDTCLKKKKSLRVQVYLYMHFSCDQQFQASCSALLSIMYTAGCLLQTESALLKMKVKLKEGPYM